MAVVWLGNKQYKCYIQGYYMLNADNPKEYTKVTKQEAIDYDGYVLVELRPSMKQIHARVSSVCHDYGWKSIKNTPEIKTLTFKEWCAKWGIKIK